LTAFHMPFPNGTWSRGRWDFSAVRIKTARERFSQKTERNTRLLMVADQLESVTISDNSRNRRQVKGWRRERDSNRR